MMKKRGKKKKAAVKKAATKKRAPRQKKEKDVAEVRKDLVRMVKDGAPEMTAAVMGEGKKGQVPPFKYLLEMAGIFPEPKSGRKSAEQKRGVHGRDSTGSIGDSKDSGGCR